MTKEVYIELANLAVGYEKELLRVPSLKLHAGELIAVLGKNGSGKSTLLKTMGGLVKPLEGQVLLGGSSISELSARQIARSIGHVFTKRPNSALLVEELVSLGRFPWLGFMGTRSERDMELVEEAMVQANIVAWKKRRLGELSDGEQQRVMIAKALAQDGQAMLLDEPTAFLDVANKVELLALLQAIAKEKGKCVIITTHDIQLALDRFDRLLVLHERRWLSGK